VILLFGGAWELEVMKEFFNFAKEYPRLEFFFPNFGFKGNFFASK
jgi:hypothetical protein